ncbi:hypothetical protein [Thalassobacillus sp. C254]|nr:hypothetical protein [Thalassobacillus sp. C254]
MVCDKNFYTFKDVAELLIGGKRTRKAFKEGDWNVFREISLAKKTDVEET